MLLMIPFLGNLGRRRSVFIPELARVAWFRVSVAMNFIRGLRKTNRGEVPRSLVYVNRGGARPELASHVEKRMQELVSDPANFAAR